MGAGEAVTVAKGFANVVAFLNDNDMTFITESCDENSIKIKWQSGAQCVKANLALRFIWDDPPIDEIIVKTSGRNRDLIQRLKRCYDEGDKMNQVKTYVNLGVKAEDLNDIEVRREKHEVWLNVGVGITGGATMERLRIFITVP